MKCPYCNHHSTRVLDKRDDDQLGITRRRRECEKCQKRFTSYERPEMLDLVVLKKDGKKQPFDRNKLIYGIKQATWKRGVSDERIDMLVTEIEGVLRQRESVEIPSMDIGSLVMEKLKQLDNVSYIRFASIYRSFADVDDFQKEVRRLLQSKDLEKGGAYLS
jgi:transcriptional repressor NrdR